VFFNGNRFIICHLKVLSNENKKGSNQAQTKDIEKFCFREILIFKGTPSREGHTTGSATWPCLDDLA
jgi:hypothetical protein